MSVRSIGWAFVGVQGVLLVALVLLPARDDWATPGWVENVGSVAVAGGLVIAAIGALGLGASLTPTPVPRDSGALQTTGLYALARHPIYSGVLLIVVGLVVPSGSFVGLAVGALTFVFFSVKARWEEARLAERYPDYSEYARRTGRFMPGVGRLS